MSLFKRLFRKKKRKGRPRVIVDFVLEKEVFYLSILNGSAQGAYDVCVVFDVPVLGHNGTKNITELPIVKNIPYLAPFKSIQLFIDPIDLFFTHLQQGEVEIETHYKDRKNCAYKDKNKHDLNIYKGLPANSRVCFLIEKHH